MQNSTENDHFDLWFEERLQNITATKFKVKRTLFSEKSPFQQVDVVETEGHGNMLLNDGIIMTCDRDEFVYHEMIAHPALFSHPNPKQVLIIGGGDGGTLREVLKHPSVESCDMVEIDEAVVRASKQYLPEIAIAMDSDRANVIIDDGIEFIKNTTKAYDVILIDSTDPIGPATPLFNEAFYQDVYDKLSNNGIVVAQMESPYYQLNFQKAMFNRFKPIFPKRFLMNYTNMTYIGALWSFAYLSKEIHPINAFDSQRVSTLNLSLKYYNQGIHKACFALPQFMKDELKDLIDND